MTDLNTPADSEARLHDLRARSAAQEEEQAELSQQLKLHQQRIKGLKAAFQQELTLQEEQNAQRVANLKIAAYLKFLHTCETLNLDPVQALEDYIDVLKESTGQK